MVVITGASGYIGTCLTHKLTRDNRIRSIIGFDIKPFSTPTAKLQMIDQQMSSKFSKTLAQKKADTLIHLGFTIQHGRNKDEATSNNIRCLENALATCHYASIKHIIYLSSTTVYGPRIDNPELLSETDTLRPVKGFQYAHDKVAAEKKLKAFGAAHSQTMITTLRSPIVMGPSANNFITKALFKPLLIGINGFDPPMQFIHEEDLTNILSWFIHNPRSGIFNVAAPGSVKYSRLMGMSGKRFCWLPASLAYPLTNLSWFLHLQNDSNSTGLEFIRHPWVTSTHKFVDECGYSFQFSSEQALRSFMNQKL